MYQIPEKENLKKAIVELLNQHDLCFEDHVKKEQKAVDNFFNAIDEYIEYKIQDRLEHYNLKNKEDY